MEKLGLCFLISDVIIYEDLWHSWLQGVDRGKYEVFIHYKRPVRLEHFERNKLDHCVPTSWGGVGVVCAMQLLFRRALQEGCTRMLMLSGSCVPLKSFNHVYEAITSDRRCRFHVTPRQEGVFPRAAVALRTYSRGAIQKASTWFILNHRVAAAVCAIPSAKIEAAWGACECADEHFYISEVCRQGLQREVHATPWRDSVPATAFEATTFANWTTLPSGHGLASMRANPYSYGRISQADLDGLLRAPCFFGRKFERGCTVTLTGGRTVSLPAYLHRRVAGGPTPA